MRIPSGVVDQYIYFVAVDATDLKTRETGLSAFTVRRSRNGGASAAYTTPTINETDTTNMPGVYELLLDEDMTIDAGDDSQEVCLHITCTGMAPVTRVFELYRSKITAGNTLDVSSDGDGEANVTKWLGTAAATPTVAGVPEVDVTHVAGSATTATLDTVKTDTAAIKAKTDNLPADPADASDIAASTASLASTLTTISNYLDTEVAAILAAVDTEVAAIKAKTDLIPASIPTANENADALLDRAAGVETGLTLRQFARLVAAVMVGKASGMATTTAIYRDFGDTKDRVTATVDETGNRATVIRDAT